MRIAVFGASGQTGQRFVPLALEHGHEVTALVRATSRRPPPHERLRIVEGDVLMPTTIAPAVEGQDAAVIMLGRPVWRAGRLRSQGTAHIIEAMRATGGRRLVCQASLGYGDGAPLLARAPFAVRLMVPLLLADTFADHQRQEAVVRESGLDWTIIRSPGLTNAPATGRLKTDIDRTRDPVRPVSREDVARLVLAVLEDGSHVREVVSVSS